MTRITPAVVRKAMLEDLAESGIQSRARVQQFGAIPLLPSEMEDQTGYKLPGYRIPYFGPDGSSTDFARIKFLADVPDNPNQRYWQASGSRPRLYLPPFLIRGKRLSDVLRDPEQVIYVTEGEKKAACAAIHDLPCVGLGGVWSWLHQGEPIPDLDLLGAPERTVVLTFDSDVATNRHVQTALRRLARHLQSLGLLVLIKLLPAGAGGCKCGLDDFLVDKGVAAFLRLPNESLDDPRFDDFGVHPAIPRMNREHAFLLNQGQSAIASIVPDAEYPTTKTVILSRKADIRDKCANQFVKIKVEKEDGTETEQKVNKFTYWFTHPERREASRLCMRPSRPFGFDPATRELNLWQGWGVEPHQPDKAHSWSLLLEHVREVIAGGDEAIAEYLLNWMAFNVQRPAELPEVAVVLRGGEGTGKGMLWRAYGKLFGPHYYHVQNKRQLVGTFNSLHANKLFLFCDEAFFAGDKEAANVLKTMITEPVYTIEAKYQNPYPLPNYRKFAMASNEDWVVPAGPDSRRFAVFDVSEKRKGDTRYFRRLAEQMSSGGHEAMLHDLLRRDLSGFEVRNYPKTEALLNQRQMTWDPITGWWFDRLCMGRLDNADKWSQRVWVNEAMGQIKLDGTSPYDTDRQLATKLGMHLRKLSPSCRRVREERVQTKRREYAYQFQTLSVCRREFERAVQMRFDWATGRPRT